MRGLALALRSGAVVVAAVVGLTLVVDGPSEPPPALSEPPAAETTARIRPKPKPAAGARALALGVVTISAVGDIVMGSGSNLPPAGGRRFFDAVKTDLAADVVLGNLEGTLTNASGSKCRATSTNCFAFKSPPSYARHLRNAGFTVLNLANNHANDFGDAGRAQTVATLARARLRHTGGPGEIALQTVGRIRVAVVGFATYPWANSMNDLGVVRREIRRADADADVVVVSVHMGAEGADRQHVRRGTETFLGENRGNPMRFAHAAVDAGADLVVGHGPHVLRGMEWRKGRLIAYSLGNFAGYGVFSLDGPLAVSGILRVTLRADGTFETGLLVPTRLVGKGVPALDPTERAHGSVRSLSKADFGRRGVRVSPTGTLSRAR